MSLDWSKYLVKEVKTTPGEKVSVRKDIRNFSDKQLYLYLEGLKRFQYADKEDPLSYFQIAGIHGRPYQTWPQGNDEIPERPGKGGFRGFCTHTSILFLTWHRPYLSLFESALREHVKAIALGISDGDPAKSEYLKLAEDFRMPYWDWADNRVMLFPPQALTNADAAKGPPSKGSVNHKYNPLFAAPLKAIGVTDRAILNGYPTTVRYPNDDTPGKTMTDALASFYEVPSLGTSLPVLTPERNLTERTAYILQSYSTFAAVSHNLFRSDGRRRFADAANWGSLEEIHNAVHNLVGGTGGHMSGITGSAFDPIFWLHHTNIDRLFAIWQALHEDKKQQQSFVTTRQAQMDNFGTEAGQDETISSPLYPFRDTETTWWTSDQVRNPKSFGYTYPELDGVSYPTTPADKAEVLKRIKKLYSPLPMLIQQSKAGVEQAGEILLSQSRVLQQLREDDTPAPVPATAAAVKELADELPPAKTLLQQSIGQDKPYLKDLAPHNKYLEWIVNIKSEKHTLGGAYTVHVFLGPPPEEGSVDMWPLHAYHVGTFSPLGQGEETACSKCQDDQADHTEVTGQIPLTIALVERYLGRTISDITEATAVPYLRDHLHWRVVKYDGTIVQNRADVAGLTVFVVSNEVTVPTDPDQLPVYAPDVKIYPEVTTDRDGNGRGQGTGLSQSEYNEAA